MRQIPLFLPVGSYTFNDVACHSTGCEISPQSILICLNLLWWDWARSRDRSIGACLVLLIRLQWRRVSIATEIIWVKNWLPRQGRAKHQYPMQDSEKTKVSSYRRKCISKLARMIFTVKFWFFIIPGESALLKKNVISTKNKSLLSRKTYYSNLKCPSSSRAIEPTQFNDVNCPHNQGKEWGPAPIFKILRLIAQINWKRLIHFFKNSEIWFWYKIKDRIVLLRKVNSSWYNNTIEPLTLQKATMLT